MTRNHQSRTYNNLMQLTGISGPAGTFTYNYTAGQNNGRIASMTDSATNETVTYQYDTLNRLIAANSSARWNTTYGYDSWGNLNSKGGSQGVPYFTQTTDPTTNGSPGASGVPYTKPAYYSGGIYNYPDQYDVENQMITDNQGTWFVYDPWGRRIWQEVLPTGPQNPPTWNTKLTFYAVTGKRIAGFAGVYATDHNRTPYMTVSPDTQNPYAQQQLSGTRQYFGNRLIISDGSTLGTDRLGSVRSGGNSGAMSYDPYGEERTSTPNSQEKFGTYFRDADGNDYAMARRYSSAGGRFATADPGGMKTARASNPTTWNRMGYAGGAQ